MCGGIAVPTDDVPEALLDQVRDRVVAREGVSEVRFQYRDREPILPVWSDSGFLLVPWGNRNDKRSRLPQTGWARSESVEAGKWKYSKPEEVVIPASFGLERGIWFHIIEGVAGLLVRDEQGHPHVYMLTQPASHYYQVMTRHDRMPVFVGEQM